MFEIDVEGRKKAERWESSCSLIPFTSIPWEVGTGLQEIRESYGLLGPRNGVSFCQDSEQIRVLTRDNESER
jgi:hypothetical protein